MDHHDKHPPRRARLFDLIKQDRMADTVAKRIDCITLNRALSDHEITLLRSTVISSLYGRPPLAR